MTASTGAQNSNLSFPLLHEAVAIFTVVDKASFKTWFDAGDDTFIDVGLALFTAGGFDINIDQLLAVNNTHARLFGVRGVK